MFLSPVTRDATAIKPGPTTILSPIATIAIHGPHAIMLDCDAMNKPDHKCTPGNTEHLLNEILEFGYCYFMKFIIGNHVYT